jgi:hypothetical protein
MVSRGSSFVQQRSTQALAASHRVIGSTLSPLYPPCRSPLASERLHPTAAAILGHPASQPGSSGSCAADIYCLWSTGMHHTQSGPLPVTSSGNAAGQQQRFGTGQDRYCLWSTRHAYYATQASAAAPSSGWVGGRKAGRETHGRGGLGRMRHCTPGLRMQT